MSGLSLSGNRLGPFLVRHPRLLACLLMLCLAATSALAQPDIETVEAAPIIEFSFSNPGARSMGFGGAFVALADDATAAFANPAGLVQLSRPEVSVEGRLWSYSIPYVEGGRISGPPTGVGIDTVPGVRKSLSSADTTGISFLSYVYPREKWFFALYRHQLANFEFLSETQGLFGEGTDLLGVRRFLDQRLSVDFDVVSYGLSAAYRLTDTLSFGLGLSYFDANSLLQAETFLIDEPTLGSLFSESSYLVERMTWSQTWVVDSQAWGVGVGFLWGFAPRWKAGGVYRQGSELDLDFETRLGPANSLSLPPGTLQTSGTLEVSFPDVYGLGVSYRTRGQRFTAGFEWDHVNYSTILESLDVEVQTIDDGDELHLGAEYAFLELKPVLAIRLGAWLDPDHRARATTGDPLLRTLRPRGEDEMHYAAGFGVAFERFHMDVGVELSDLVDTVSISAIYSF